MAVALDASSPVRFTGQINRLASITSASFTAPANTLLAVCVSADGNNSETYSVSDTGGLTWTAQVSRDTAETTSGASSGIWTARTTSATARTVSVTRNDVGLVGTIRVSAKVYVWNGVDVDGTPVDSVTANNEGGSSTNSITTTSVTPGANGVLLVADCDWSALGAFETSSDLTGDTDHYAGEVSVYSGYKTVASGVSATGNLNAAGAAAAQHKWCQIVIREAAGGGGGTTSSWMPTSKFVRGPRNTNSRRIS